MLIRLILLTTLISGCAGLPLPGSSPKAGSVKLPLPACPPVVYEVNFGWLGPKTMHAPGVENHTRYHVWGLIDEDRDTMLRWQQAWIQCAVERGIVIEEENRNR